MTSSEWTRWQAYAALRPFGDEGADLRAGVVAASFAGGKPLDHMPVIRSLNAIPKRQAMSDEELKAKAQAIADRHKRGKHG